MPWPAQLAIAIVTVHVVVALLLTVPVLLSSIRKA